MGEDSVEIDVSVDPRIVVAVFDLCFAVDSTSTRGGAIFIDGTCFGLFGFFTPGIGCLPSP